MHLAIDASRTTVAQVTGTEHYAIQLIRGLIQHNPGHRISLYFRDAPAPDLFPESEWVQYRVIPFRRVWTHLRFAVALWGDRPDLTFVPAHTLPLLFPGPGAVTVHDLGFKHFPDAHPDNARRYLDWSTRYSARRASVILADSQATADDLTRFYGTPSDRIQVVYPGVDPIPVRGDIPALREKYGLPARYFLFIGTLQPRKNIARIVQAYARFREMTGADVGLVLAGGQGWLYDPAWVARVEGVHLTGYVDDADKGALYAGALALVFTTLYEGFGFPVVEAMGCGTPVIASNTSSLPELVGDVGLTIDPLDTGAIAAAMQRIAADDALRESLRQRGPSQAARFNWDQTAATTWDVFRSSLNQVATAG